MSFRFRNLVRLVLFWASAAAWAAEVGPAQPSSVPTYVLAKGDRIRVAVLGEAELTTVQRLDGNGKINMPLIGDIPLAGLTIPQSRDAVAQDYASKRFLRKAEVSVSVEEYAPREVSIQGQVKAPGRYQIPVDINMNIMELVTKAGGLTDVARGGSVKVTRVLSDGSKKTYDIDVDSMIKGKKGTEGALILLPGDIVYVPERLI
jgi:polysaccharide export outer membrane protein